MLKEGLREMNPRLLGPNLWKFWWRDLSGSDMVKGRYGYLRTIGQVRKIAGSDEFDLLPGDVAVIGSGAHVLIYVGGNRWVEANPDDGKVVINAAFTDSVRPYFNTRATFMRWRILEEEPENTESH
jgi:cell wall-associated NlpC family hydrolase